MRAHRSFDRIWQRGYMDRHQAYLWLAKQLGCREAEAHMGEMHDLDRLNKVVTVSDKFVGVSLAAEDFPEDLETE